MARKGPIYQEVFLFRHSGESNVTGHWVRASTYLHVDDGRFQSLSLGGVGRPREGWCLASALLQKGMVNMFLLTGALAIYVSIYICFSSFCLQLVRAAMFLYNVVAFSFAVLNMDLCICDCNSRF